MTKRRNYTNPNYRFKAAWCPCGHAFNNEVQPLGHNLPDRLITAAARFEAADRYGQSQLDFRIVTHCPTCGQVCDQAWSEECYVYNPADTIPFVMGRDDPGQALAGLDAVPNENHGS